MTGRRRNKREEESQIYNKNRFGERRDENKEKHKKFNASLGTFFTTSMLTPKTSVPQTQISNTMEETRPCNGTTKNNFN